MSCQRHDHLPTPLVPKDCEGCHPRSLSELMGGGAMSSNEATRSLLSDVAGGLRDQLRQGQEANRQQAVLVDQLRAEVAGLKRGLSAAKRDLRRSRDEAARLKAEVTAIVEAMERLNRPEAK